MDRKDGRTLHACINPLDRWLARKNDMLCARLVEGDTFVKLNEELWPGCYYARSDANDVARVEDRTFICSFPKCGGAYEQLGEPVRNAQKAQAPLQRVHGGTDDVRFAIFHGTRRIADVANRCSIDRFCIRGCEHADLWRIGLPVFIEIDRDEKRVVPCLHSVAPHFANGRQMSHGLAIR